MADNQINEATWDLMNSFHDTNQAAADSLVAAQDRNLRFAQNIFLVWTETMDGQTQNAHRLMDQWTQQLPRQQEAFQRLMNATLGTYMNFLRIPFSYNSIIMNATQTATQQAMQFAQHATREAIKAAGTVTQRELEQAQVWTFENPLQEAESQRPVVLRVNGPGIVHAGVNREGEWIRMHNVPLIEVSPGVWEAYLLDPEVNEFTFIWYDPNRPGAVHWEGKNYPLSRRSGSGRNAEKFRQENTRNFQAGAQESTF